MLLANYFTTIHSLLRVPANKTNGDIWTSSWLFS